MKKYVLLLATILITHSALATTATETEGWQGCIKKLVSHTASKLEVYSDQGDDIFAELDREPYAGLKNIVVTSRFNLSPYSYAGYTMDNVYITGEIDAYIESKVETRQYITKKVWVCILNERKNLTDDGVIFSIREEDAYVYKRLHPIHGSHQGMTGEGMQLLNDFSRMGDGILFSN